MPVFHAKNLLHKNIRSGMLFRMAKCVVGDRVFPSKAAATKEYSRILNKYAAEQDVTDPEDVSALLALLQLHPDTDLKQGPGVAGFFVRLTQYKNPGFWLRRIDGTSTDWSFNECLAPRSEATKCKSALRTAVVDQILQFKDTVAFPTQCPFTAETLYRDSCHVDHEIPFLELLNRFLLEIGRPLETLCTRQSLDGETHHELTEPDVALKWQAFHQKHAKLRVVSPRANLSILRKKSA